MGRKRVGSCRTAARSILLAGAALAALPAGAAEVGMDAIDGCIDRIRAVGGPDAQGGTVLSTEYSEANSLVMFRDAGGTVWRCLVANDGTVADLSIAEGADDGGGAMAGSSGAAPARPPAEGTTATEHVRFKAGASSASMNGGLTPGSSVRYVLGARDGQFLDVTVQGPGISYQIFNPDGSFLLDQVDAGLPYRGQLWQRGDHVVEVINRSGQSASYTITFAIR